MFAYFIGGPEDLTKRVIPDDSPAYYNVAELPDMAVTVNPYSHPSRMTVGAKVHTYVRRQVARDTAVYVWDRLS